MGKGRPRAAEKGVLGLGLGHNSSVPSTSSSSASSSNGSLRVPPAPVYYPNEDEFKDPLEFIDKIRPEAERYGICRIVPPKNWQAPFALDLDKFSFPTKTQAIHQLQARAASCDSKTFELEYNRFLEEHCGRKLKKKVVFEGEELDLCKLFNGVKRFGGYDKVVKEKKWGEVSRFLRSGKKISECAKHVLCQLYREHLYDYEEYYSKLNKVVAKSCKRGMRENRKSEDVVEFSSGSKRRRKNSGSAEKVKVCKKVEEEEELDQICKQCRSGLHGEVMLLCDRCNKGWHIYCLSPPLKQVPPGNWYCFECLNSDKDSFGFVPGKNLTLEAFRRVADRAKRKWFGSGCASRVQIEKKFWEIVEGLAGDVEVMYGSDLDTSVYGSGFPRINDARPESVETKVWDEYCGSPWNLNNLPKLKGSVLRAVHQNITGVMVPWLYVGMLFSAFCWHFEDHCFYSMNYLHWGEPKCWYSVPGSEADAFEKVMRNSLPDLFDAQPDLLFQLVTMLNPSVLQDNGVPVYSVLQEPGNFVITFPRSYHGGFNLGLNCAEAVNFAPADWLPHGGFGAELYQTYHKTAVLSHEELLCVVAKANCDSKVSPFLKKELVRMYTKEKTWRERLWRNGIIKSSPMPPRKCPEFVGTEEDPTCIICKQYLYLSAVVCRCRPSAYVCLEHWEHICECKSSRFRLLYRHTLAELYDLVLALDKFIFNKTPESNVMQRQTSCSREPTGLTKKIKGSHVSLVQLAEQWLLRASEFLQSPYSGDTCTTLLKDAEEFLWAGSEVHPVRNVVKNLIVAQNWVDGIAGCLCKIKQWSGRGCDLERKVHIVDINELLNLYPVPCNEAGHLKLKEHADEARILVQEIESFLSTRPRVFELEALYSKALDFPIYVQESEKLSEKISSVKVLRDSMRQCLENKASAAFDIGMLYKLKSEILELQVELPETEVLLDLLGQVELCQERCSEMLKTPCTLKDVEGLLEELNHVTVNVPELMLLKQCHADAIAWIARCNEVLLNAHEREDQHIVVEELNCLLKDGPSFRIQVDQLPLLEVELKKACCRERALKARDSKMSFNFIQQLLVEAAELQLEEEKLFVNLSRVLSAARCWEEKATKLLGHEAQMSDFEELLRWSTDINVILPSLNGIIDAVEKAKSWLQSSAAFLARTSSLVSVSCSSLKIELLKELVSRSKLLNIALPERKMLEMVLKNCEEWEQIASSALGDAVVLLDTSCIGDGKSRELATEIELLVTRMEVITKNGLSLGYDFLEIPKLLDACSKLQWCRRALSYCSGAPHFEDVQSLMKDAENFSVTGISGALWTLLFDGVKWLQKSLGTISNRGNFERCKLSDVEEILAEYKHAHVSYPEVFNELVNAVQNHKLWRQEAEKFLGLNSKEKSWSLLLELKERGMSAAFSCSELDIILSEVGKVEKWKKQCMEIVGRFVDDGSPLLNAMQQIKRSLDIALFIHGKSQCCEATNLCMSCTGYNEDWSILTCSLCKDCYHLQCVQPVLVVPTCAQTYICSYCHFLKDGSIVQNGGPLQFGGRRPELRMFGELLSDAESISIWIEEKDILRQIVEQAVEYKACLRETLNFESSYLYKDIGPVSEKLTTALKAMKVIGVYDYQCYCDLEMALARNSWKVRVERILNGVKKPTLEEIQMHIKEGQGIGILPDDYLRGKLRELEHISLEWADEAKKVAVDSGALALDKVFELILKGASLPVYVEEELKLLKRRSMLYCICRKPYDDRPKVVCDQCDEWYHIDCLKLRCPPKIYICAACNPQMEDLSTPHSTDHDKLTSPKFVEPKTPPRQSKSVKRPSETKTAPTHRMIAITDDSNLLNFPSGIDRLWWQNRKPFRRAAKKRAVLDSLSPFFNIQQPR
ncbi:hypothetical protein Tsubulata_036378 [Turnera subulata]|uniref:[Histone H3]-trimethyl-L-lysine(4) demethylase n=1 Tax=Turnera subulata TaxID=218843 RepID=A0A9Q0GL47_9ROSI|nr:hypothetical protein Tsubulata_036378 [Turnera subulata]